MLAGAAALVLRLEVAAAAWQRLAEATLPWAARGGIEHGIYFGWASAEGGVLRLAGRVCSADDPVVTVSIPHEDEALTLGTGDVRTEHADLGLPERVAALSLVPTTASLARLTAATAATRKGSPAPAEGVTPPAWHDVTFRSLVARCRSGAETQAGVGIASWLVLPPTPQGEPDTALRVVAARAAPHLGVLAALVVANEGREPVTVARLTYAPDGTATGRVRAAAGTAAQLAGWRWLATGPGNGAVDPAGLTPWHAAYQSPEDPRAMRARSAEALGLSLAPGEVAMIVIDQGSLAAARPPRRVILYPVLSVTNGTGTTRSVLFVGSPLPAVGWTTSGDRAGAGAPP
ncbi:MAG: hypothetical protein R6W77_02575 [Trueperaceae bacterium]